MKSLRIFIMLGLSAALVSSGCGKLYQPNVPPTTLPAATQEGKHTFGCYVNGALWLPLSNKFSVNALTLMTNQITAARGDEYIILDLGMVNTAGVYNLTDPGRSAEFKQGSVDYNCTQGTCVITRYDNLKGIVSGTFSFKAASSNGTVVSIDNGRFDLTAGVN